MGRFRAASLLFAALAVGVLLTACGSNSGAELLPGTTADQINSNLDLVRESVDAENCEEAEDAVAKVSTEVDELHKVDTKLKEALEQGAAKLSEVVSSCNAPEEEQEAEEAKVAEKEAEAEQEAFEAEEAEAEEEAFEKEQKAEARETEKAQEKAEKEAEQPEPPGEGEESGKGKESQEETVEPPTEEEVTPPSEGGGGGAGGIGPGAAVEGGP
jgi:hypothetical protein